MDEIKLLTEELVAAAAAYYQDDVVLMSDDDYDNKLEYLLSIATEEDIAADERISSLMMSPSAGTVAKRNLVTHVNPMLSLGKAKNEEELKKYHEKLVASGAKGFTLQTKLDGLAMSVTYENGKIKLIATRGDGTQGEDMSYLIDNADLTIENLPSTLNYSTPGSIELRGEIFIRESTFITLNESREAAHGEKFANSRNAVAGIVKKAEKGLGYHANLIFIIYSTFLDGKQFDSGLLCEQNPGMVDAKVLTENEVANAGVNFREVCITGNDYDELHRAVELFGKLRPSLDVPTDGVVIKPQNEMEMLNKLGFTSHHPVAYIAYKYPGVKVSTEILEITVSVGKTGALTPQARVRPVKVDGSVLTNFTCHNYNWLHEKGIREGAKVLVTKANDVIPAIDSVIIAGDNPLPKVPTHCPYCSTLLINDDPKVNPPKTLYCPNETCSSRMRFYIRSILGRTFLHIDGIGDVVLDALIEAGQLNSIVDLFSLSVESMKDIIIGESELGNPRRLGDVRAKNIRDSINVAMEHTPDFRLLGSLGIDGVGSNTSKRLIGELGSIYNVINATEADLERVDGFGEVKIANLISRQAYLIEVLEELKKLGVKINETVVSTEPAKGTFSVSGGVEGFANREDFVAHMEGNGWVFDKSPKKTTDILFADPDGTSSKIQKARANGTRIINRIEDI